MSQGSTTTSSPAIGGDRCRRLDLLEEDVGERLDRVLARRLPELSRSRLKALVLEGRVTRAGRVLADPGERVKPGPPLEIVVPAAVEARPRAEQHPLEVLFEDEHLIVLVKPAGMVVHPAPGHEAGTLVNALLAHCGPSLSGIGGVRRPGIVHRLDREVSGVLVAAKHDRAHLGLSAQFTVHSIERIYEAIVWGVPSPVEGRIDKPIGRHPRDRLKMAVVEGGKRAVTRYRVLETAGTRAARLELALETGRTHQIRVHLASIGHPILGDRLYAPRLPARLPPAARARLERLDRIALHARELAFTHPMTGARLRFAAPAPPLFGELLALLRS
ncbi:MAG: RluA family pseudouridine synthase [Geminicoccaceae bacterium]|nr:RluA family pseudouridine synthase [Geminicoccaceae bacterium]MCX8100892.1 RluA family pseudouridine synthase [Geminicoccaceae bacterium]